MEIKFVNYSIENILWALKLNLTLLNKITRAVATLICPISITHKQKRFKQPKCQLELQKERKEYNGEISIVDKMSKNIKVKTRKARKVFKKYKITSIDKIPLIKKNWSKKFN